MFWGAESFNQPLNKWNVSNDVTDTEGMFNGASSFNQPLHAPWYVSYPTLGPFRTRSNPSLSRG